MKGWRPCSFVLLALSLACGHVSEREARALVERYNLAVSEAYRRGDINLIDNLVAPDCVAGRNLTGLIGVRLDMGITLDSRLDDLQVTRVEVVNEQLQVHSRERWSYRDLRIGTGEQVGEASVDHYEMLYLFKQVKGAWMVTETKFTSPPKVGRKTTPWRMDARDAHAMAGAAPKKGGKP
jgi:hypothetical protein